MLDDIPPFLTVEQAGEVLQIGRTTAYGLTTQWSRTGGASGLPFVRVGRQKRVPREALVRYVESQLAASTATA